MIWPPDEQEWPDLLRGLPANADRVAVRKAVADAVRAYVEDADRDQRLHEIYQQITSQADSRSLEKLRQAILELKDFPSDERTEAWLRLAEQLRKLSAEAKTRAESYLPTTRRLRLLSQLARAWSAAGHGNVPGSETGAFADFIYEITVRVLPPNDQADAKRLAQRFSCEMHAVWTAQAALGIDETRVFQIDQFGNQKP
jgi:hypothetical protein